MTKPPTRIAQSSRQAPPRRHSLSLAILCLIVVPGATADERIAPLPGDRYADAIQTADDGNTIAGHSSDGSTTRAFLWTPSDGIQPLLLPGDNASFVSSVSGDGTVVAGDSYDWPVSSRAYVWTRPDGAQPLGEHSAFTKATPDGLSVLVWAFSPSSHSLVWTKGDGVRAIVPPPSGDGLRGSDISDNGSTVVGDISFADDPNGKAGFVWTNVAGLTVLDPLPGYSSAAANGVSADGSTVVGSTSLGNSYRGVVWRSNDIVEVIPPLPGSDRSFAFDTSASGTTTVGSSEMPNGHSIAFVYTTDGGTQPLLPPGALQSSLWKLSEDGSTVVGSSNTNSAVNTFRWHSGTGIQNISVPGFPSSIAMDALLDNARQVIVGIGFGNGGSSRGRGFVWSSDLGIQELSVPGYDYSSAYAVSSDGQVIIGTASREDGIERAVVWTASGEATVLEPLNGDPNSFGWLISTDGSKATGGTCNADWSICHTAVWTVSTAAPNEVPTPTGDDVTVEPVVTLPEGAVALPVQLTFDSVTAAGITTVTASNDPSGGAPPSPPQFSVGEPPVYYDVDTTANLAGPITLCFSWQEGQFGNEGGIGLFHFEGGDWHNVTLSLDIQANKVCGQVTSLSPFALFESNLSFAFSGFFQPVDNRPTRNITKAGSAIPIKFSLGGDQGLGIFPAGYPVSQSIACDSGTASDNLEETSTAGSSGLSYDAASGRYTYVWKTQKAWAGACRRFALKLIDGTEYMADFEFKK